MCTLILPQGVECKFIFPVRTAVFEIWADFQNFHVWAVNLEFKERSQSCIYTFFLPKGVEIKLIFAPRTAVSEIQADFQNFHSWA